jgi:OOP family OmpA-OmpF porin
MLKPIATSLLLAAGALAALPAQAQVRGTDWGTFIGASIGDSDLDTTLKLFGGQLLTPNWGWEASFIDFGSQTNRSTTTEAWALGGSLLGVLPLNAQFSAFGKLGAYYVKSEVSNPAGSVSDSSVELGAGVGLRFAINPQFSLRLELESIGGEGGDVVSLGAQLRF